MQRLLTLGPQEIQTSVFPGVGEAATPIWSEGEGVYFADLGMRKQRGVELVSPAHTIASPIRSLLQGYASPNQQRVYYSTIAGLGMYRRIANVVTHESLYTWPSASNYSWMETWGTWLVATNGINPVVVWKNAGVAAPLAGTPFTWAKIIKRKSPYLLAFNTNVGDTMFHWSHTSDIENWAITADTEAGNLNIRDLESGIIAAVDLGDRIAIYSSASMGIVTYVGRPNVFGARKVLSGIGALSARSVVGQGPFNYGLTMNGIFKTDGNSYLWIDDPAAQRWVKDHVNYEVPDTIFGFHDDWLKAIHWFFIDKFDQPQSVSYFYNGNQFVTGRLALEAAAPRDAWDVPIVVGQDNKPGLWQKGELIDGERPEFVMRTKPLDFGARDRAKVLQLVRVDGTWDISTRIRVGALADPEGAPDWFHDSTLKRENYFEDEREDGYFVLELSGDRDMYVSGIEFYGVPGGVLL